jgi:hypothetical protein
MKKSSLSKRATAASAKQAGALSLFERAAVELEAASDEHLAVAQEATAIVNTHLDIVNDATTASKQSLTAAAKIRQLVG